MFCTVCGTKVELEKEQEVVSEQPVLEEAVTEQPVETDNAVAEETKTEESSAEAVCPYCGSALEPGQIFCTNWGQKLGE